VEKEIIHRHADKKEADNDDGPMNVFSVPGRLKLTFHPVGRYLIHLVFYIIEQRISQDPGTARYFS